MSSKNNLTHHMSICKEKSQTSIKTKELEKEVKSLKKELEKIKDKPSQIINNNTVNNTVNNYGSILTYMTPELVLETFKKLYDISTFLQSDKGLANFTTKHFLTGKNKPYYICVDKSRKKFIFTDENKKKVEDVDAGILIGLISNGMSVVTKFYEQQKKILCEKMAHAGNNHGLVDATYDQMIKLEKIYKSIIDINKGGGDRYCSQLAKRLPSCIEDREVLDRLNAESDDEKLQMNIEQTTNIQQTTIEQTYEYDDQYEYEDNNEKEYKEVHVDEKAPSADEYLENYYSDTHDRSDSESDNGNNDENETNNDNESEYNQKSSVSVGIGGCTFTSLRPYKNHYQKTQAIVFPKMFVKTPESIKLFHEYLDEED